MTVLAIGGGRDAPLGPIGWHTLDELADAALDSGSRFTVVKHGDAAGADRSGGAWARSRGFAVDPFPADWRRHGRGAGPKRTAEMVASGVDFFALFPGGKGTDITAQIVERAPEHTRPRLIDLRRQAMCVPLGFADIRGLAEEGYEQRAYATLRARSSGIGPSVAHVGAFHDDPLPGFAVYVGGKHHGREASTLALPCTRGEFPSTEAVAADVRGRFARDSGFRALVSGVDSRSLLVCSCGSRACHAPILATAVLTMHCTRAMARVGRSLPPSAENGPALVSWSKASLEVFSVCA